MLLECVITSLIFGISPVINKYFLTFISVEGIILFSGLFYSLFILLYLLFFYQDNITKDFHVLNQNKHLYVLLGLSAFFIFIVANYFYLTVIKNNSAYLITAIVAAYPIFTAILGYFLLNEYISIAHSVGIMFIFLGVFLLNQ